MPTLLLLMPGGGPFAADQGVIIDLGADILQMASDERATLARLMAAAVDAKAEDVVAAGPPHGPYIAAHPGEQVVESAAGKGRPAARAPRA